MNLDSSKVAEELSALDELQKPDWPPVLHFHVQYVRASFHHHTGSLEVALQFYEEALSWCMKAGDSANADLCRIAIADLTLVMGRVDDALQQGLELRRILRLRRHSVLTAYALEMLAAAWLAKDDVAQARDVVRELCPLAFHLGDRRAEISTYSALLSVLEGRAEMAAMLLGYSDSCYSAAGRPRPIIETRTAERAQRLAQQRLGQLHFEEARTRGATLTDNEVEAFAVSGD